jgi:MFS transporter, PAT family, beta-lactamase induction signal transducer AmpG
MPSSPPVGDRGGAPQPRASHPLVWVITTYVAEGFPYALVNNVAEVLFKELGASLQMIGLTAIFHLPWNLKFLWAPPVDRYETKRRFMIACEIALVVLVGVLAILGEAIPMAVAAACFVALAFVAATHDITIDGFYLEGLDRDGQSRFVGLRAAAYRGAALLATGPLLIVAAKLGWGAAWAVATALLTALMIYHATYLPRVERRGLPIAMLGRALLGRRTLIVLVALATTIAIERHFALLDGPLGALGELVDRVPVLCERSFEEWVGLVLLAVMIVVLLSLGRLRSLLERGDSAYARAFLDLLAAPRMGRVLAFIVLFRVGESFLMKMRFPFLRDACRLSLESYALINGTLGFLATMVATLLGGWLIGRHGLRRWLWPFLLAQNVPNLLYAALAGLGDPGQASELSIAAVVIGEDFGAGLGTAVFMVYIMRCCDPRHKATHMAVLTAIMSIGFTFAGMASGFLAEALGFGWYFTLTFVATLPSMMMVRWVPYLDRGRADELDATP